MVWRETTIQNHQLCSDVGVKTRRILLLTYEYHQHTNTLKDILSKNHWQTNINVTICIRIMIRICICWYILWSIIYATNSVIGWNIALAANYLYLTPSVCVLCTYCIFCSVWLVAVLILSISNYLSIWLSWVYIGICWWFPFDCGLNSYHECFILSFPPRIQSTRITSSQSKSKCPSRWSVKSNSW